MATVLYRYDNVRTQQRRVNASSWLLNHAYHVDCLYVLFNPGSDRQCQLVAHMLTTETCRAERYEQTAPSAAKLWAWLHREAFKGVPVYWGGGLTLEQARKREPPEGIQWVDVPGKEAGPLPREWAKLDNG